MGMFNTSKFSIVDKPLPSAYEAHHLDALETSSEDVLLLVRDMYDYLHDRPVPDEAVPLVEQFSNYYSGTVHGGPDGGRISPGFALKYKHLFN